MSKIIAGANKRLRLQNILVVDGTGHPKFLGALETHAGKITRVFDSNTIARDSDFNGEIFDGKGKLIVMPGIIDVHTHDNYYIFHDENCMPKLSQGVTTVVAGNCGYSCAPVTRESAELVASSESIFTQGASKPPKDAISMQFRDYLDALNRQSRILDIMMLVGHGNLRSAVMGFEGRKATNEELNAMKDLLREAMEAGAIGLSSGLYYPPGAFADQEEMVELCRVVAEKNGIYATHIRDEGNMVLASVNEAIEVARMSGVRLQISHLKIGVFDYESKLAEVKESIEKARASGIRVFVDQYPYNMAATTLSVLLPPSFIYGGNWDIAKRLTLPENRKMLRKEIFQPSSDWDNTILDCGYDKTFIAFAKDCDYAAGKSLQQIGVALLKDPLDAFFDIFIESKGEGMCTMEYTEESCIEEILKLEYSMVASDGILLPDAMDHPRGYATFPRVLGHYSRDMKTLSLETAIHKMTGMPADHFQMKDRGLLKPGLKADLVVFNPDKVIDLSNFRNPKAGVKGIEMVIKNGQVVLRRGELQ